MSQKNYKSPLGVYWKPHNPDCPLCLGSKVVLQVIPNKDEHDYKDCPCCKKEFNK